MQLTKEDWRAVARNALQDAGTSLCRRDEDEALHRINRALEAIKQIEDAPYESAAE